MNDNRPRRQHSITTTVRDSRSAAVVTQTCRRSEFDGGGIEGGGGGDYSCCSSSSDGARHKTHVTNRSVFYDRDDDTDTTTTTMATSVAVLERFQQPTTVAASPSVEMVPDVGGRPAPHHRGHCLHNDGCRPRQLATKYNSVSAGSALSKSMRYADGWLYARNAGGTVGHGAGASRRNQARSTFLGREDFGGVAVTTAAAVAAATAATAAAATTTTTTLASTEEDPYDRVRRNRMAGGADTEKLDRKQNRSGSLRTPSPDYDDTGGGGGGRINALSSSRRSILESTVNPYDLLRQPSDDDDDDDMDDDDVRPKRMSLKDKFMNRIQDTVFAKNKSNMSTFSSFSSNNLVKKTTTGRTSEGINIAGHTVGIYFFKYLNIYNILVSYTWAIINEVLFIYFVYFFYLRDC